MSGKEAPPNLPPIIQTALFIVTIGDGGGAHTDRKILSFHGFFVYVGWDYLQYCKTSVKCNLQ